MLLCGNQYEYTGLFWLHLSISGGKALGVSAEQYETVK